MYVDIAVPQALMSAGLEHSHGIDLSAARKIARAARRLPPASRRIGLPEQIDDIDRKKTAIIWDDPEGREGFALPNRLSGFGT